jgi:hypothetical protein
MTLTGFTSAAPTEESTIPTLSSAQVRTTSRAAMRYCLTLLALPLLAVPVFIALGCSNFFMHHGASVWVRSNDAVFEMTNRDCDVLIFGD